MNLAFSCTKGYPGQANRNSLSFQVEAVLKYLVVPLTFAHDCTSLGSNVVSEVAQCCSVWVVIKSVTWHLVAWLRLHASHAGSYMPLRVVMVAAWGIGASPGRRDSRVVRDLTVLGGAAGRQERPRSTAVAASGTNSISERRRFL